MMYSFQVDTPYIPNEKGCRLVWRSEDDEEKIIYLRHADLAELNDVLSHDSTAKIELEDGVSSILVNSDVTEFFMAHMKPLDMDTRILKEKIMEFMAKNPDA